MDVKNTPLPVKRALKKLGQDLCDARKKRHIPMQLAAERAAISRTTLSKIERGDEGVSVGAYAKVLFNYSIFFYNKRYSGANRKVYGLFYPLAMGF